MVTLQGPYVQGIWFHFTGCTPGQACSVRDQPCCAAGSLPHTGTEGLGRSVHVLDVPRGEDVTGKEGVEQDKESCRAPRGTLLHIPVSSSLGSSL